MPQSWDEFPFGNWLSSKDSRTTSLVVQQPISKPWCCNYRLPGEINFILPRLVLISNRERARQDPFLRALLRLTLFWWEGIAAFPGHTRLHRGSWHSGKCCCPCSGWMVAANWMLKQITSWLPAAVDLHCCILDVPIQSHSLRLLSNL